MFEPIHLNARISSNGKLHLSIPDVPPEAEVRVVVSEAATLREVVPTPAVGPKRTFASREEWEAHARRIVGSMPDIERPDQGVLRDIEPL